MRHKIRKFVEGLLFWGSLNKRDFPWRKESDPYKILIAELMLQRTKAEQVVRVYEIFLERFPKPRNLAKSSIREIERIIKPLGLAYRAKRLKMLGEEILSEGGIPSESKKLTRIHGVGDYAASAVLCFAYGQHTAVVDSNVARIVKRVFSLNFGSDPHKREELWKFMQDLVPEGRAKEFNWSILDFGSLICAPKKPKCNICPLNSVCDYYLTKIKSA